MDRIVEARAYVNGRLDDVCFGVDEETGTITEVKRSLTGAPRQRYPGRIVLPAAVDLHVHLRDPGHPKKEDFASGTKAALLGGVGTVFDMPNTSPTVDTVNHLAEKAERVAPKAHVDYGLWATVTGRTKSAQELAAKADGVKLYMAPTTGIEHGADDETLGRAVRAARRAGRLVMVHAEAPIAPKAVTLAQHEASRTITDEVTAVRRLRTYATARDRIQVAHVSSVETAQASESAGFGWSATPHHLLLAVHKSLALVGKVNPPLRSPEATRALFDHAAASDGWCLESDHAPHTREDKDRPFSETPAGLPGVQTMYPLMLRQAKAGRLDLGRVVGAACARPGRRVGVRKGEIREGFAADYVVVDPSAVRRIESDWLVSRAGWSPFEGHEALVPETVVLGGELCVEEGHVVVSRGRGRRVRLG